MANRPRYVDTRNPALAIDCPNCGLRTARFMPQCRNCGYSIWPSGPVASAAFRAWQAADPPARGPLIHHAGRYRRLRPTED